MISNDAGRTSAYGSRFRLTFHQLNSASECRHFKVFHPALCQLCVRFCQRQHRLASTAIVQPLRVARNDLRQVLIGPLTATSTETATEA